MTCLLYTLMPYFSFILSLNLQIILYKIENKNIKTSYYVILFTLYQAGENIFAAIFHSLQLFFIVFIVQQGPHIAVHEQEILHKESQFHSIAFTSVTFRPFSVVVAYKMYLVFHLMGSCVLMLLIARSLSLLILPPL